MRIKLTIIFILLWALFFAGLSKKRMFKNIPYGTVRLTDSLYIDKQPIRVVDYIEFLSDIRRSYTPKFHDSIQKLPLFGLSRDEVYHMYDSLPMDSAFYNKMLTRTMQTVGNDKYVYSVDYHLTSSKYYNYPIVNVNFIQINEFCKWRTDKVKLAYAVKCRSLRQRKKYPINFEYRILTHKEWEKAMGTFIYDVDKLSTVNSDMAIKNLSKPYIKEKKRKFYYDSNNAAEFLDQDIITVGFNWIEQVGLGDVSYMQFEKPTDWVTFRCICEIKEDTVNIPPIKEVTVAKEEPMIKPGYKTKKKKDKKVKGVKTESVKRKRKKF